MWRGAVQAALRLYRRTINSTFAHSTAQTYATRLALVGLSLATSVISARALGPEGRGLFVVASSFGAVGVQFGNLGLHVANTYYVARDRRLLPGLVGNSLLVGFVGAGAVACLLGLLFYRWPSLAPVHGYLLGMALLWVPVGLTYMLLQNLLLGLNLIRGYNRIEVLSRLFALFFIATALLLRIATVQTLFLSMLASTAAAAAMTLIRLNYVSPVFPVPVGGLFRQCLGYGFRAYLVALFGFMLVRADVLMVQYILGPEQAGYYSTAASMADVIYIFPSVVAALLFPRLSALSDPHLEWRRTWQATVAVTVTTAGLGGIAALVARPVTVLLYGQAFLPAVPPFLILTGAMVFYGANNTVSVYLASRGFPPFSIYVWILAFALNVTLNLILIPTEGITGAALASLVCYFIVLVLQLAYVSTRARKWASAER